MKSFDDICAELTSGEQPCLLIGNGFSQALNADIFNYSNLLERAKFGDSEETLRELFAYFGTYDFERVMNHLLGAEVVSKVYGVEPTCIDRISGDQQVLKDALIGSIGETHPDRPSEVSQQQFTVVRKFLARFGKVFSVNYDLLLYWARNQNLAPTDYKSDDGFRAGLRWAAYSADQNVFFVHGALHLYDTGSDIKKLSYKGSGESIIDQVRENLNAGRFPLFVSEPTAEKKRARIERNPYLNHCYRALAEISSDIVIFGHAVNEHDKHIFDQIRRSNSKRVFVSLYGAEDSAANVRTKANAQAFLARQGRSIDFFSAESAPVWT